jgi:prephenate dehydratase
VAVYDTAGAAKQVAEEGDPEVAAIAGRPAAHRYALRLLAEDIEDRPDNQTRFAVVTRPDGPPAPEARRGGPRKSFLVLETEDRPGALVRVLAPFAEAGVNLSKLESRPGVRPWSYRFFLEVEADQDEPAARDAFERCREAAIGVKVLGSYPKWG